MEYLLYSLIKDRLLKDKIILNGGVIKYTPIPGLNNVESKIDGVINYDGLTKLKNFLTTYENRIDNLITKVNDKIIESNKIPAKIDPNNNLTQIFENSKFKELVDDYNKKISDLSWTGERINNEIYNDQSDPNYNSIFFEPENDDLKNFNNQLLALFSPYLSTYESLKTQDLEQQKIGLNTNLDDEIKKLNDLIQIAKQFDKFISEKRKNIDNINNTNYDSNNIIFIDNSNNTINSEEYLKELKEAQISSEAELNLANLREIILSIENVSNIINIKNEMKDLNNFDFLQKTDSLNKILNIEDIITINPETNIQTGGTFENHFITDINTNKKLMKLLKLFENLFEILENILSDSQYLKELQYRYNFYIAYLFLIIRESASSNSEDTKFYKYLTKDIINKYIDIYNKIKNKFNSLNPTDVHTIYLNKYHYLTIDKILNCLIFINNNFPSDKHIVHVDLCKNLIRNDLILFNHFRKILIKYINTDEGKNITEIFDLSSL